jgi:DNA polymerase-4
LRSAGVRAGTVAVKIRDSSFRTITRQRTLPEPTDLTEPIYRTALELARPEVRGIRVRLLGVTASNLGEREQLALFEATEPRKRRAVEAADASAPLRRAEHHPCPPARDGPAGAVRARSAQPARSAARGRAERRERGDRSDAVAMASR